MANLYKYSDIKDKIFKKDTGIPGIKRRDDGTYYIDFIKVIDGKRYHLSDKNIKTLEEAINRKEELIVNKNKELQKEYIERVTLSSFMKRYLDYRSHHVRYNTYMHEEGVIRIYMKDYLHLDIKEALSFDNIQKVYKFLLSKNATETWKNRAFGVFRKVAEVAFRWKLISLETKEDVLTVMENIPEHRERYKEKHIWNEIEKKKFFSVIDYYPDKVLFALVASLGLRISELCGLTWDCFDEENGYMNIKQQLLRAGKGKLILTDELKTAHSYRECKIPKSMLILLKEYKNVTTGEGFIFRSPTKVGAPLTNDQVRRRLYKYIEKAGVSKITMHAFRHMRASEFMKICQDMEEIKAAAIFMGHSATMLVETYGHVRSKITDELVNKLVDMDELIK